MRRCFSCLIVMIAIRSFAHKAAVPSSRRLLLVPRINLTSAFSTAIRGGAVPDPRHHQYDVSVCSVQGSRSYMEDTFFVSQRGDFTGVFDGHGGPAVSLYLRQNLYANLQAALPMRNKTDITVHDYQQALRDGLDKVDREVQRISHWSYQGSTAVAAWIHRLQEDNQSTLIVANVGDSRAILSRNSTAIALTHDHKPDSIKERERIEAQGGEVIWCGVVDDSGMPVEESGVYRVNGNLALSRAIGDRSERPAVTAEPEFTIVSLDEEAQFVVLATDGLWDVMTSQEVVQYINLAMYQASNDKSMVKVLRANMADFIVAEALRRGTVDNVTVVIVWLTS